MKIRLILTIFISSFLISYSFAQDSTLSGIAVLPFNSNGIDPDYVETSESILSVELSKLSKQKIISVRLVDNVLQNEKCLDVECVAEVGKKLSASQALSVRLSALGEKIIIQYFLVDVKTSNQILIDQLTTTSIEELETAMKRIAKSVISIKPANTNVEVGTVLEADSEETLRRSSNKNIGLSFGYLYPQNGYGSNDRFFVADLHLDYELEEYAVGMLLGIRSGFAINIYSSYLFSKTDFCPFIGGAFGFHWVANHYMYENKDRGDGFEITANTGMRILHTYNFQILVNLEFIYTINDYDDTAIVFTIGIL